MDGVTIPHRISIISPLSGDVRVDLAVVSVSWNVKDLLLENLKTIRESLGNITIRLIVVDNASSDGTVEVLQAQKDVICIANTANLGFAKAVNQGIAKGNARHVLLLNPDMRVEPTALADTVAYLDTHPEVGVLGGQLLDVQGKTYPSVRRFPDIWSQLAILLKLPHLLPSSIDRYMYTDFDYTKEQEAPSVRGSYFAMSQNALAKLGGLDELYFIWFEEVDYCMQVWKAGLKIVYVPTIRAFDLVGRSFAQRKRFWKQKQFSLSMSQYFWKWHPGWRAALISVLRPIPMAVAWIADKLI